MLLTAMLAMNAATAAPVDDKEMGAGVAFTYPAYGVTVKKWGTLDMLPGIMEDGPGGVAAYVGIRPGGYGLSVHARVNLEKDFWTPPFELGFADMAVFYGVGANVDFTLGYYRNLAIGAGAVVGWQFALNMLPVELCVQFEPGLNINVIRSYYSLVQFRYYSGLVARYYF